MHVLCSLIRWLLAAAAFIAATCVWGQAYPNRPIRIIVPGAAGTSPDVLVRMYSQHLQGQLGGVNIIVDNRPGANGMIGSELAAKAAPDGYTLLYTSSAIVLNQIVHARVPYNIMRDFVPLTLSTRLPGSLFLVPASLPVQSMPDLIAMVKSSGQPLRFGSPGVGNVIHIIGAQFGLRTGLPVLNVPYKGAPQIIAALISGEVQATVSSVTAVAAFLKTGQLRPLAYTGRARWPAMPELPTMNEAGVNGFVTLGSWDGWFLPARTPNAIVQRLNAEIRKTLQLPSVQEFAVERGGNEIAGNSPAEFTQFINGELKRYADLIRELGIRLE
jgi:tripartite-type tricarboxylate transporter receptor subunit TctC